MMLCLRMARLEIGIFRVTAEELLKTTLFELADAFGSVVKAGILNRLCRESCHCVDSVCLL